MMMCDIQNMEIPPVMLGTLRLTTGLGVAVATSGHFLRGVWGVPHLIELFVRGWGGRYLGGESSSMPRQPNTIHNANDIQHNPQRQGHRIQSTTPMTNPIAKCKIKTLGGGGEHNASGKIKGGYPVQISIKNAITQMRKDFTDIEKEHLNKIVRNALLDTGYQTQRSIRATYDQTFTKRNKQFENVITRLGTGRPARKMFGPTLKNAVGKELEIVIFDERRLQYMQTHTTGGIKTPYAGSNIAIPGKDPGRKLRYADGQPRNSITDLRDESRTFVTTIRGQTVLAERKGKKRLPINILYLLEPSAKIKRTFAYYDVAMTGFRSKFPINFSKEFNFTMNRVTKRKY